MDQLHERLILFGCVHIDVGLIGKVKERRHTALLSVPADAVYVVLHVVDRDPFESLRIVIHLIQSRRIQIHLVEFHNVVMEAVVQRILEQEIIGLLGLIPFADHRDLIAHKVEHLPGVDCHIHVQSPALREFHFIVSEDLVDHSLLAMHDFIVRQRKKVTLIVKVEHGKGQSLCDRNSLTGLLHEVIQRVIHPSQIPFIVKSESALIHWFRAAGIGCGILCDQHGCRMKLVKAEIHLLEEVEIEIVNTPVFISHPVDQSADRVEAKAVKMILSEPVIRG